MNAAINGTQRCPWLVSWTPATRPAVCSTVHDSSPSASTTPGPQSCLHDQVVFLSEMPHHPHPHTHPTPTPHPWPMWYPCRPRTEREILRTLKNLLKLGNDWEASPPSFPAEKTSCSAVAVSTHCFLFCWNIRGIIPSHRVKVASSVTWLYGFGFSPVIG